MELDYLNVVLDAKIKDYEKQLNLKKFYKETLTEDEYKSFEKLLKTKKTDIIELEGVVSKMSQYSDQFAYERIMAMSETEFNSIKDDEIERKKNEIKKHNAEINDKNASISRETESLKQEIIALKKELEEMTNNIAETGKYTKETVMRAKKIKDIIKEDNERINKNDALIESNDKNIIVNNDVSIDFDSYKQQKLSLLSKKKYVENIPEVSAIDEFLCKSQKKGKTPEEMEEFFSEFKNEYVGGFDNEGYEFFDEKYREEFDIKEELDENAKRITEFLGNFFDIVDKGKGKSSDKGVIERNVSVKKRNVSDIKKIDLLRELIGGDPYYKDIKDNKVLSGGCFINLNDRINITKERIDKIKEWKSSNPAVKDYDNIIELIKYYKEINEDEKEKIEDVYERLYKYLSKESFENNKDAVEYISLYNNLMDECKDLKEFYSERDKIESKKLVLNKKEHNKALSVIDEKIDNNKESIKDTRKAITEILDTISKTLVEALKEPESIMYPSNSEDSINTIYNVLHPKNDEIEFSLSNELEYLESLENSLEYAEICIEKYTKKKEQNKKGMVAYLCANLGISSVTDGLIDILLEEKNNGKDLKADDIRKRINEAKVNLYLREQKEKAESEAAKAKSEILGAVLNHLDLEKTKTDIFAEINK